MSILDVLGANSLGRAKPFIYLGKISYGLYAFHFAALLLCDATATSLLSHRPSEQPWGLELRAALALVVTVVFAAISYRYFETPILRYKQRFEVVRTRPA